VAITAAAATTLVLVLAQAPSAAEHAAQARFATLRTQVSLAAQKGESLDTRAVALVAEAADALVAHDVTRAEQALDELERILAAPRVSKP
jgi:hypothetical protein